MGRHGKAELVGAVAHRANHGRVHLELTGRALLFGVEHAAGDHELDEVDALRARDIDLLQGFVDAVRRDGHRARHVTAGHRDSLVGSEYTRSVELAGGAGIAHARVEVAKSADGADGGDAAVQLQAGVLRHQTVRDGARKAVGHDLLDQGFVVALLLLGLSVASEVHVHVDEAREQVCALEVDELAGGEVRFGHGGDLHDALPLDDDRVVLERLHVLGSVEHVCVHVRSPLARGGASGFLHQTLLPFC